MDYMLVSRVWCQIKMCNKKFYKFIKESRKTITPGDTLRHFLNCVNI